MLERKPKSHRVRDISIARISKIEQNLRAIYVCLSNISSLLGISVINPTMVVPTINEVFGVDILTMNKITGKVSRKGAIAKARAVARYILSRYTNLNYTEIAELTGANDHTTISVSVTKTQNLMDVDDQTVKEVDACIIKLLNLNSYEPFTVRNLRKSTTNGEEIPELPGMGGTN
jgi:chromosomal replication initiation ATPase DnaA